MTEGDTDRLLFKPSSWPQIRYDGHSGWNSILPKSDVHTEAQDVPFGNRVFAAMISYGYRNADVSS